MHLLNFLHVESLGQSWVQFGELALALVLSTLIGRSELRAPGFALTRWSASAQHSSCWFLSMASAIPSFRTQLSSTPRALLPRSYLALASSAVD